MAKFVKGQPKPPRSGRKAGTPNKFSKTMKEALEGALEDVDVKKVVVGLLRSKSKEIQHKIVNTMANNLIPKKNEIGGPNGGPIKVGTVKLNINFVKPKAEEQA